MFRPVIRQHAEACLNGGKTMPRLLIPALAALALLVGGLQPTLAANDKSRDTTMGESGKPPPNDNAGDSNGTKSSNKGNPDNTNCNDCGGPGKSN
jgi:hypothetical protein